ncbi:MAG: hypothetical protein K2K69_00160, partial [Muribaculaceae bacterium]|nr:hypothetical protein [Muribaculaceae bacterium]
IIQIMVTKVNIVLLFISSVFSFVCVSQTNGVITPQSEAFTTEKLSFFQYMDSSVNNVMLAPPNQKLAISDSIITEYKIDFPEYDIGVLQSNYNSEEYLFMGLLLGGSRRQFGYLMVMERLPKDCPSKILTSNISKFITSNGAYIGMSLNEFLGKYPNAIEITDNLKWISGEINVDQRGFLQYDKERLLYNQFLFKDGRLVKIEMGYDY